MVDVEFVSSNPGKVREVRRLLAPYGVRVRWLRRRLAEPQAATLEAVARSKLRAVANRPGWVLVEDSGLFIPSLGGFPGVYSAHILEIWGFGPVLELLRRRGRSAEFRTVAALSRGRTSRLFSGVLRGSIARRAAGRHGFGYDPIFRPARSRSTLAELPVEAKNALSHRARAMRQVGDFLAHQESHPSARGSRAPGRRPRPAARRVGRRSPGSRKRKKGLG